MSAPETPVGTPPLVPSKPHVLGRPDRFARRLLRTAKRKPGSELGAAYRLLRTRPARTVSARIAVRAILLRTALELVRAARRGGKDLGYETYHQMAESGLPFPAPLDEAIPTSFAESFVRAAQQGGGAVEQLVDREAAALLGEAGPGRELLRTVRAHLVWFEALAFEGLSLRLW